MNDDGRRDYRPDFDPLEGRDAPAMVAPSDPTVPRPPVNPPQPPPPMPEPPPPPIDGDDPPVVLPPIPDGGPVGPAIKPGV